MRITIGKKLIGGLSIVMILFITMSSVFVYTIARMNNASNTLIENLELDMFLDEKIGDHLLWFNDLSDQFLLGRSFEDELDPNKCDFWKWYNIFKSNDPDIMKIHAAIGAPHRRLHISVF